MAKAKKIFLVGGARPNFVKLAALVEGFKKYNQKRKSKAFNVKIIHTGQHYDDRMTKTFFRELKIPQPYINLNVGSATHGIQTARIMERFEELLMKERPDMVVVVGDVNSTVACSLVAVKMGVAVIHVEAGLRSFDRTMPEEINRLLTDQISDLLFTTSKDAHKNLAREGVASQKIKFVGNVMVDTLYRHIHKARKVKMAKKLKLPKKYAILTLHRPANVDRADDFGEIVKALEAIQKKIKIVFPVHPRTAMRLKKTKLGKKMTSLKNILMSPPLSYLEFISLVDSASLILTDSGGIQEESTALGIPCLTLRDNTERPVTQTHGTNLLIGRKSTRIIAAANRILKSRPKKKKSAKKPAYWDGKAADRIAKILAKYKVK